MSQKVLKKGFKNYAYAVLALISTTLLSFVGTPIIIKYVGKAEYGIYQIILQYLGYMILWDLGLSTTSCSLLNKAHLTSDRKAVIKTIKFLLKQYFKIIPLIVLVICIITYLIFITLLKDFPREYLYSVLLIAFNGLYMPLNVFKDYLRSSENLHIISKLTTLQLSAMTILNIVLSIKGFGLLGLAFSNFLMISVFYLLVFIFSFREIIKLEVLNTDFEVEQVKVWHLNFHSLTQNILGQLSFVTDTIILSFFNPAHAVTNFVTNQRLAKVLDGLLLNIGNSFWASISNTTDINQEKQNVVNFVNKVFILAAFPFLLTLALNNKHFIGLWLGEDFYISDTFTWIAFSNYLIFAVLSFWGWLFVGAQKMPKQTFTILIAGIINIVSSVFLTKYLGIIGPVLGTFISFYGFYLWHLSYVMKKELDLNVGDFLKRFSLSFAIAFLTYSMRDKIILFAKEGWPSLLLNLVSTYIVLLLIFLAIVARRKDLIFIRSFLLGKKNEN